MKGDYKPLDEKLEEEGIADRHVARLPDIGAQQAKLEDVDSFRDKRRHEHWRTRVLKKGLNQSRSSPLNFPVASPWLPSERCKAAVRRRLAELPLDQFVFPKNADKKKLLQTPGHLDLFSGSRGAARALAEESGRWVLTFDIKHSQSEDLLQPTVQENIQFLLEHGAFLSVGAAPVCASFSRAVRPAVRDRNHPRGFTKLTENMAYKVRIGNLMSQWLCKLIILADQLKVTWWVENPRWQLPLVATGMGAVTTTVGSAVFYNRFLQVGHAVSEADPFFDTKLPCWRKADV